MAIIRNEKCFPALINVAIPIQSGSLSVSVPLKNGGESFMSAGEDTLGLESAGEDEGSSV